MARTLFATAERSGAVITTRQALATISYTITGGLQCTDVHRRRQRGPQRRVVAVPAPVPPGAVRRRTSRVVERGHVPAIDALRRLDPGAVAMRSSTTPWSPSTEDVPFLPPTRPWTRRRLDRDAKPHARRATRSDN